MILHSENRKQQIEEKTEQYFIERIDNNAEWLMNEFQTNMEKYAKETLWTFDRLFKDCIKRQETGSKEIIGFIAIYFLRSSYLLGTYELQIDLYSEQYLFDKKPVTGNYALSFIKPLDKNDWEDYLSFMKKNIIRISYHELYPYRQIIADKYKKLLETYFLILTPFIQSLKSYHVMKKQKDIKIIYGEYMCKGIVLNQPLQEE